MERLGIRCTSYAALAVLLASCSAGFQGGTLPEKFKGITSAEAISPESVQLSWEGYPGATQYRLYGSDSNNAIAQPQFTSIVFKPNIATASSTKYAITAVSPSNGTELGSRTSYIGPVPLLPRFNFKTSGSVAAVEASGTTGTRLKVSWTSNPKVTYRVYVGERSADGVVSYGGFVNSAITVTGQSNATLTGLLPGREYCTIVVAAYLDNTNDGPDATPFTTEITSTLNGWATGTSGTFGDSKIAASQKCARTSSSLVVDRVKIYSQKAYLSTRPIFYVYDSDHPTENDPASGFEASIYQVSNTTGLASYVGKTSGTGQVISLTDLLPGRYKFYAIVTGKTGDSIGSMAKKELIVGTATSEPDESSRAWIYIRGFPDLENSTAPTTQGYYPEKQQDGLGSQRLGSSVAVGDFDCDGKYDLAVGIPNATETSTRDGRSAQSGKVVIYYAVDDSIAPTASPAPRSQIITFDVTPYDINSRDLQLGTSLYVGNFNKDNQRTNQNNPSGEANFQCHDLAIGSGYGPMFVVYGKRNVTGLDGGLNYSGSTGYAVNPSSSCDTSTNVCSPALYTMNGMTTKIGLSISSGNFNGSGYEDLVATTANALGPSGTLVFRGSENGLIPPSKMPGMRSLAQGCSEDYAIYPFPDGPKKGYPYLPSDPNCFYAAGAPDSLANGWGKIGFGSSVGAFPNAYYDLNGNATGTHRMRDVLLIGNPNYQGVSTFSGSVTTSGRVYACRPTTDSSLAPVAMNFSNSMSTYDMNDYFVWNCGYNSSINGAVIDSPLNGTTANTGTAALGTAFGTSIQGIRNALLYDKGQLSANGNSSDVTDPMSYPNKPTNIGFPGAVAIGAAGSSNIFMYYGVHFPEGTNASSDGTATRDALGASRNNHFNNLINATRAGGVSGGLSIASEHPCRIVNSSGVNQTILSSNTAYREKCDIQLITPPGGADWSSYDFAKTLFAVMGSNASTGAVDKQVILAVPAPNRAIASSGSVTFDRLGSVQLYYQSVVSESNGYAVRTKTSDASCDFCRFSDGFANAGSSSIDFDGNKRDNIQFGAGGIAAGPLKAGSGSSYNTNADLVIGVPGYVFMHGTTEIVDSGAAQISFSHGGQFRSYQPTGTVGVASPWHFVNPSYGQESDIRYHQTIAMGDIDQDGFDDVGIRVKLGSQNLLRIMKGKSSTLGASSVDNVAGNYIDFKVQGDLTGGMRVIPLGKISTSAFPVYLFTGANSSYLYFGGVGGLITGQPSAFASGGAPRKLSAPKFGYLPFNDASFYRATNNSSETDFGLSFAHGDFNGDGYEDVAIAYTSNLSSLKDPSTNLPTTFSGMSTDNYGRVMIFYGGRDNGFQVQADINGGYPLNTDYFAPYSLANGVTTNAACNATGVCNKVQILYEGAPTGSATLNTLNYGKTLATVPAGACNGKPVSALLVQTQLTSGKSKVFIYKPKCVTGTDPTNLSGLIQDSPNSTTLGITTYRAEIDPANFTAPVNTGSFGVSMTSVTGIFGSTAIANTDAKSHLVLTDSNKKLFMSFPLSSDNADPANNCTYDVNSNAIGSCRINLTNTPGQGYQRIDYSTTNTFIGAPEFGMSISSIGDVNGDGFADVAISIPALTKPGTPNTSIGAQGAVMVLFGADKSRNGLQTMNGSSILEPATASTCYRSSNGASTLSICNPTLIFAPQPSSLRDGSGERVYLSRDSRLNFGTQNENLGSFLFGVPLRDTRETNAADRILRGGAFYVLP